MTYSALSIGQEPPLSPPFKLSEGAPFLSMLMLSYLRQEVAVAAAQGDDEYIHVLQVEREAGAACCD